MIRDFMLALVFILSTQALASQQSEAIRQAIQSHLKEAQKCYKDSIAQNSNVEGKIVIDFEVDDEGQVSKATVNDKKSTLKDPSMGTCLTDKFKTWTFPAAGKGEKVSVSYPFIFQKQN